MDELDDLSGGASPMRYSSIQLRPSETGDEPIYDREGNVAYAPEEKGPGKGFLQSIMDDVNNPPNRRERPKEIGFGPK